MSGLNIGRSLVFSKIDTPTREGEVVETVEDIMNIPTPREGMIVYVRSEKKNYVVLSLKEKVVDGATIRDAQVGEYEELYGALVNMIEHGQISAGRALEANVADKVKDGNVTLESLGDYLRKRVNVADSLDIADPERPLSARQGVVLKEEIARAIETVINGAPGSFDTLKEIADWINSHGEKAADIVAQLVALAEEIGKLNTTTVNYCLLVGSKEPRTQEEVINDLINKGRLSAGIVVHYYANDGWRTMRYNSISETPKEFLKPGNWVDEPYDYHQKNRRVYLTEAEYEALKEDGLVDESTEYNIFEDEQVL